MRTKRSLQRSLHGPRAASRTLALALALLCSTPGGCVAADARADARASTDLGAHEPPPVAPAGAELPASAWIPVAVAPAGYDREAAAALTLQHLQALIALDTQNPPGNELVAARYLESAFAGVPGVETAVLESAPGRANFVARLAAARPIRRPVLIMAHTDVVGVQAERWDSPPFTPEIRDGYLYGRGAIDDKGMLAAAITALTLLAPQRERLTRDIVLLGTAGEEGGPEVGIAWVLEHARDRLGDPEFALNEGGRIRMDDTGTIRSMNVQVTEKIPYDVVAVATGPSGHGSVPLPDNALAALSRAVARVHDWRAPLHLNATTRLYFRGLAAIESSPSLQQAMLDVGGTDAARAAAAADLLSQDPLHNAVLRTGQSLTLLQGGIRSNVIPSGGRATFNVRALPDDDILGVVAAMQRAGGESAVTFTLEGQPRAAPPVSPLDTSLHAALVRAAGAMAPGAAVIPFMSTGATDGAALRAVGIPTYGILPFPLPQRDELRMHGDNERVPVPALGWGTELLYRTLSAVGTDNR